MAVPAITDPATAPRALIGVIGGSGFYRMPGLAETARWLPETPFGRPSDEIVVGELHGKSAAFIPRHGAGHRLLPTEVPYRANIWALKAMGVQAVIAVSAVGSLRKEIKPGQMVVPDQLIDRTRGLRESTFFGDGVVVHAGFADPFCADLSGRLAAAADEIGQPVHRGGAYVCMEGPHFSTRAESRIYRSWDAAIIGMTAIPEAKLAREAELAYAMLATATDYDVWNEEAEDVSADAVAEIVRRNVDAARAIVASLVRDLPAGWRSTAEGALHGAIMTDPTRIPAEALERCGLLLEGRLP